MVKNKKVVLVIALLAGISIFTAYKYIATLREKYTLIKEINQIKKQVVDLENEKQNLLQTIEQEKAWQEKLKQENAGLKDGLRINQDRIIKLQDDLTAAKKTLEQLNAQVAAIQAEYAALKAQNEKLKLGLSALSQENENYKARFNSLVELKKAIRELKTQTRKGAKAVEGNQGFVIKDGKTTFPAKVIIEVNPALNK